MKQNWQRRSESREIRSHPSADPVLRSVQERVPRLDNRSLLFIWNQNIPGSEVKV